MFKKNILIKGRHADYMKRLVAVIDAINSVRLFERNLDVYILAPIVGLAFGRTSQIDNDNKDETSIHTEQLQGEIDVLTYNYRLVMLSAQKDSLSIEERTDRAFRFDKNEEKRKEGDELFQSYVLGGIDVLYEKILADTNELDDYLYNLFEFFNEYNERYNSLISSTEIIDLCKLASD